MFHGLRTFFGDISKWAGNPNYFAEQANLSVRPTFSIFFECFNNNEFVPGLCVPRLQFTGFVTSGSIGYNLGASAVVNGINSLLASADFHVDNNNTWKTLSDAFEASIGAPAFGFRSNGPRVPTNSYAETDGDAREEGRLILLRMGYVLYFAESPTPPDPPYENYESHSYVVAHPVCNPATQANCTLDNVYCLMKCNPAPRKNGDTVTKAMDEEQEILMSFPNNPDGNPILTHVFDADRRIVNETLPGHDLHDGAANEGCGDDVPIPNRCSVVERFPFVGAQGKIFIANWGTGYNPTAVDARKNEVLGKLIFTVNSQWVSNQVLAGKVCQAE